MVYLFIKWWIFPWQTVNVISRWYIVWFTILKMNHFIYNPLEFHFWTSFPKILLLFRKENPPLQRCRNVFPGWLFGDMYLLFTQYFEAFATVLSMTWLFPRRKKLVIWPKIWAMGRADPRLHWQGARGRILSATRIASASLFLVYNPCKILNTNIIKCYIWVWVNTYRYIFSGMNIHLPAILGFTRYQGFDPSPYIKL